MNSASVVAKASTVARRLRRLSPSTIAPPAGSKNVRLSSDVENPTVSNAALSAGTYSSTPQQQRRWFGSGGGSRGARGHGWWVNYRAGKGGQHLQGTYSHLDLDEMASWNDAVFLLGSRKAYLDVKLEALAGADDDETEGETASDSKTVHRLTLELATEALPKATENVLKLIEGGGDALGYHSTTLHRIEKGVGILGGLVANNPHFQSQNPSAPMTKKKMGMCHPDFKMATSPTAMDVSKEHLVLNHLQGVVTMLQPRIGEIDSRFLLLSHDAPHLDGVSVAIGRLADDESLQAVKTWESSLITSHGVPTNATLRIVGSGLLEEEEEASAEITPEESASSEDAKKQQTTSQ